ncbi:MAG: diacylglycerol kinase family protein [Chitinophagaceae bacterium]
MPSEIQKNITVLCNPIAGVGKAISLSERIVAELSFRKISFSLFKESWPLSFEGYTDIWIIGGDGTMNYFVNHYPEIQIPLVIFKGGSGNDFHWMLYGDIDFEEQLELVLHTEPKPVDLGKCNERYFINGVGIGFEGDVVKALTGKKKRAGKSSFMSVILKKIFTYRSAFYKVLIDGKINAAKKYLIVDISNGKRAGGGFLIAPVAKTDDGLLDVILIDALHPLKRLRWLPVMEKGKHLDLSFVHHINAKHISIECDKTIEFHLDGEYHFVDKVEIEILPGKLFFRY